MTCDFRLPHCARTDCRFCGQQCRLWWYRHRGIKRPDFPPGGDRYPAPHKKGQPKTFAQALAALSDARAQVARLEATARQQQTLENQLRNHLMEVTHTLTEARSQSHKDAAAQTDVIERHEQDLKELRKEHDQRSTQHKRELDEQIQKSRREASELRNAQVRAAERAAGELRAMTAQRDELAAQRESLTRQNTELGQRRGELASQLEAAERNLTQRDGELQKQRQNFAAVERAHQEVHVVAASESRSLRAEKERRIAAEQRIEQLAAERKEVRQHRDDAIAERELLAARILKLMAPGQYLEHAAAAGYDLTKDPLIRLKREEVLVENRLAAWQEAGKKSRRARRLDSEQTLDEQAYAAALSFRWKQINHPHLRRKQQPRWIAVGFLLDAESERYLLTLTEKRNEQMKGKMEVPA